MVFYLVISESGSSTGQWTPTTHVPHSLLDVQEASIQRSVLYSVLSTRPGSFSCCFSLFIWSFVTNHPCHCLEATAFPAELLSDTMDGFVGKFVALKSTCFFEHGLHLLSSDPRCLLTFACLLLVWHRVLCLYVSIRSFPLDLYILHCVHSYV